MRSKKKTNKDNKTLILKNTDTYNDTNPRRGNSIDTIACSDGLLIMLEIMILIPKWATPSITIMLFQILVKNGSPHNCPEFSGEFNNQRALTTHLNIHNTLPLIHPERGFAGESSY